MTRTKAAGSRLRIHSERRAARRRRRSRGGPGRRAWRWRPGPPHWPAGPARGRRRGPGSQASAWVSSGTSGKKRRDWRPSGSYPRGRSSRTSRHPSRAGPGGPGPPAAGLAGWVRSTMKWASPSAPSDDHPGHEEREEGLAQAIRAGAPTSRDEAGPRGGTRVDGVDPRPARSTRSWPHGQAGEDVLGQVHRFVDTSGLWLMTKLRPPPPLLVASVLRSVAMFSHLIP